MLPSYGIFAATEKITLYLLYYFIINLFYHLLDGSFNRFLLLYTFSKFVVSYMAYNKIGV